MVEVAGVEPASPDIATSASTCLAYVLGSPRQASASRILREYPLEASPDAPKERCIRLSCCCHRSGPAGWAERWVALLKRQRLPVDWLLGPLAWSQEARSLLLALVCCQHLYNVRFLKRPPDNLYMQPMSRLSGSRPFTPIIIIKTQIETVSSRFA